MYITYPLEQVSLSFLVGHRIWSFPYKSYLIRWLVTLHNQKNQFIFQRNCTSSHNYVSIFANASAQHSDISQAHMVTT